MLINYINLVFQNFEPLLPLIFIFHRISRACRWCKVKNIALVLQYDIISGKIFIDEIIIQIHNNLANRSHTSYFLQDNPNIKIIFFKNGIMK